MAIERADVAVIGSGPGGAVTAALLAENGRDVALFEEGGAFKQRQCAPFGIKEMQSAYRRGAMTTAFGKCPVSYAEGRCLGGGSEVNSGLYHRPPPEMLRRWNEDEDAILSACADNENELPPQQAPGEAQPASARLLQGASKLGWSCPQTPRLHKYENNYQPLAPGGARHSMSESFLPRFAKAGGRVLANCEARALRREKDGWRILARRCEGGGVQEFSFAAREVVAACGAVRTPSLLRRSGFKRNIGDSLRMHVFVRAVAEFDSDINAENAGIGPHQIDEFAPRLRIGCAASSKAHIALALAQSHPSRLADHEEKWRRRAAYYAAAGGGRGFVRATPGGGEAVFYHLSAGDFYDLADGMRLLAQALFAAGARMVLPVYANAPALCSQKDLWKLPRPLLASRARLTSVHLMASCPAGKAADKFGRVHGEKTLRVADASLFCDTPNVNPQGTVMALARRNALAACAGK